jgi:hypothetical protein
MMKRALGLLIPIMLLAVIASTALAQVGGGYDLSWSTIDGGGGSSNDGGYTLTGTIGQADAAQAIGGGTYTLSGGFWIGGAGTSAQTYVFLPLVLR